MKGAPIILSAATVNGYPVEQHRYADRLGFLPESFWVCRSGISPWKDGHGDTAELAIADMLLKQERKAA